MRPVIILIVITLSFSTALGSPGDFSGLQETYGKLPLYFIENQGQVDEEVAYYLPGADKTLYFTSRGVTFSLSGSDEGKTGRWNLRLDFVASNPDVKLKGEARQEAVFSYFKGKPEKWKTNTPTFSKLVYHDLWPGIDLVYTGTAGLLKYEFRVKPGADPSRIRMAYRGASKVSVGKSGALQVTTQVAAFEDGKPYAYQMIDGEQKEVSMNYSLDEESEEDVFSYGFDLGAFDPDLPLILDPAVLVYCGYIGGSGSDWGDIFCVRSGIALDAEGNAYVVGETNSSHTSFPVTVGPDLTHNGDYDVFVAKVNAQGTGLVYCGYIGGDSTDKGSGISLDSQGNAYVTGHTQSDESSFPVTVGPDLTFNSPGPYDEDAFIVKVNAQGTGLVYCGYIGGVGNDYGNGIDVDDQGNAYVTGQTQGDLPVKVGPDLTHNGDDEAFVAKVNVQGTDLEYCGYIGGSSDERGFSIAVDGQGNAYVTGRTKSGESSFPIILGPGLIHNGGYDAFVARINALGTNLDFCGYIGGQAWDQGMGIAVDAQQRVYVTGRTGSDESSFPVKAGPDLTYNGDWDGFVARVNTQGTDLEYCGYIGGALRDLAKGIAVDDQCHAHLTGMTESDESMFPVKIGPDLSFNGGQDAFVARIDAQGSDFVYCGFIGGAADDVGECLATDDQGNAYIFGKTSSDESSFPVTVGPDLTHNSPGTAIDAFVAKVQYFIALTADSQTISALTGGTVGFVLDARSWNANRNYLILGSVTGTSPGKPLPGGYATLPLNWDVFTDLVLSLLNTPVFSNFLGKLDANGRSSAQLYTPPLPGTTVGVTMYYAYCCNNPFDFVSNPVEIEIVP